jgi:hypothetical protein
MKNCYYRNSFAMECVYLFSIALSVFFVGSFVIYGGISLSEKKNYDGWLQGECMIRNLSVTTFQHCSFEYNGGQACDTKYQINWNVTYFADGWIDSTIIEDYKDLETVNSTISDKRQGEVVECWYYSGNMGTVWTRPETTYFILGILALASIGISPIFVTTFFVICIKRHY